MFIDFRELFLLDKENNNGQDRYFVSGLAKSNIKNYVFIDDLCGSGDQLVQYSSGITDLIHSFSDTVKTFYISMFATKEGLNKGRESSSFTYCDAVYEMDDSYKALDLESRYLSSLDEGLSASKARDVVLHYGNKLHPAYAAGWKNSQMLMGFSHNVPDNCPAFIWYDTSIYKPDNESVRWSPIFRRYHKF